jgi:hypothetical protein
MSPHVKANALIKLPSPLTFLAYALDPSTVLIGPFLEFQQYTEFVYARGAWAERTRPHGLFVAARSAVTTVVLAAAHVFLSGHFPPTLYTHARWAEFPLWYRCLCIYLIPLQVVRPPPLAPVGETCMVSDAGGIYTLATLTL